MVGWYHTGLSFFALQDFIQRSTDTLMRSKDSKIWKLLALIRFRLGYPRVFRFRTDSGPTSLWIPGVLNFEPLYKNFNGIFLKWPVCTLNTTQMLNYQGDAPSVTPKHIQCDIIARPCCIGSEGRCEIVNQAYCDAHNGTFHPDKALCSQVSFNFWTKLYGILGGLHGITLWNVAFHIER